MDMLALLEYLWAMQQALPWLWKSIDISVKCLIVLTLAAACTRVLHRASAALRHMVWATALVAVLVLPILALTLPPLAVRPQGIQPASAPLTAAYTGDRGHAAESAPHSSIAAPPSRPGDGCAAGTDWHRAAAFEPKAIMAA